MLYRDEKKSSTFKATIFGMFIYKKTSGLIVYNNQSYLKNKGKYGGFFSWPSHLVHVKHFVGLKRMIRMKQNRDNGFFVHHLKWFIHAK